MDAEIEAIMTDGFKAYNFHDGKLGVVHLIYMVHARAKFVLVVKFWIRKNEL